MLLSVIFSFRNEEDNLKELIRRVEKSINMIESPNNIDYELIFVDDDSTDNSYNILHEENKNNKRIKLSNRFFVKRKKLKEIIMNKQLPLEERFKAQLKLSNLPRNSSKTRVRNRCQITGRPHGVYRKLKISRIALRQLGLEGKIPGMVKSSW